MEHFNITYPSSGRTIKEEAILRATTWFAGREVDLNDVVDMVITTAQELFEELETKNGY